MQKWEYVQVRCDAWGTGGVEWAWRTHARGQDDDLAGDDNLDRVLNRYGAEGWELVAAVGMPGMGDTAHVLYFKRPID